MTPSPPPLVRPDHMLPRHGDFVEMFLTNNTTLGVESQTHYSNFLPTYDILRTAYKNILCGGDMTEEYEKTWDTFNYWCEGVLTTIFGTVGFVGNVFSMLVLSTG